MSIKVPTSLAWCKDAQRYVFRFIELQSIFREMLSEVPENRKIYWQKRLNGIDGVIRSRYYGNTLSNAETKQNADNKLLTGETYER